LLKYLSLHNHITVHHVDTTSIEAVRPFLNENTVLLLLETPTNPLIKVVDIPSISQLTHELCPRSLVVVDNTMLSPYLQNPFALGADIVYESGTKYLSGHHDLMAGVVAVQDTGLGEKLHFIVKGLSGCALAPFDCWLLLRGVKTLALRMEKQQSNAIQIAYFLESYGFKVRYPGLQSHPNYDLHRAMARGPGAVLSFETGNSKVSERVVNATRIWGISMSFGCINSLISMPCKMSHASIDPATRAIRGLPEDLIRLCVGIEEVVDLIQDLKDAMTVAGAIKLDFMSSDSRVV